MFKKKFLALVLLLGLGLAGCSGGGNETAEGKEASVEVLVGDRSQKDEKQFLNTFLNEEPTILDSSRNADNASNAILTDVMEPLYRNVADDKQEIHLEPAGAESYEVSEDGLVYTFKLRDNKWADGQPVTAEDYVFGIKRSVDPKTGGVQAYLIDSIKNVKKVLKDDGSASVDDIGVKALDDKTLEITLDQVTPYFLELTYQRPMLPQRKDFVEKYNETYGSTADKVMYCGPYVVKEWIPNSKLVLEKNPNYWDVETASFETINYNIMGDQNTQLTAFDTGEIDSVSTRRPEWQEKFKAKEDVNFFKIPTQQVGFFAYNTKNDLFKNEKIRQAFAIALDRDAITAAIFDGVGESAYGWVTPVITSNGKEYRSQVVDTPLKKMVDDNTDPKELFIEGLKELGMDEDPSKITVKLSFGGTDQFFKDLGEFLQNQMTEKLGIKLEIDLNEWPIFSSKIQKGDFEVGMMAWGAEYNDPMSMLGLNHSNSGAIGHGWVNEDYDKLLDQAAVEQDQAKRFELYKQAEDILMTELPVVPLRFGEDNFFVKDYMKGISINPFANQSDKYGFTQGRGASSN